MANNSPVTGPFPDGDSRNITLAKSDHPFEPERSGPAEPRYREDGAPQSVMGNIPYGENDNDTVAQRRAKERQR